MARVVVLGGSGSLGRAAVDGAVAAGHEVVSVSRRRPAELADGVTHRRADVTTGAGLAEALADAEVVIEATNAMRGARDVLVDGTRRVLEVAAAAGVGHFIGISIVGIDDAPLAYYRTKVAQERVIAEGAVPWSLVRATQFHDLVARVGAGWLGLVPAPRRVPFQPVDVRDVAPVLVAAIADGPGGRLPDVGGPAVLDLRDALRAWKAAARRRRLLVPVPLPRALGRFLRGGGVCTPDRAVGTRTFAAWLDERYPAA